ncbi:ead/Ea22-like family protein [Enterobacter hormaechei]|uniref:ead/Ea22-like family protein n=1 Tax=Enterobacter hormaechei TaxID=158836 RepID=UPI0023E432BE|nr:ead/Ea22-like family protein [Enterobacter hormaechei]MCM8215340.1 ead/Ea22-like family protein [Enterobacter hormaechei]MDF3665168.1 ead/Ea22-like family protein [Enterobacter hormaechei]
MSNIDKQALRKRYSAKPTPKCDICGARMTMQRMSGSRVTYGCSGAIYDETGCHYAEGRSLADDHYEQSRVTVTDESDPDVLALLDELEAKDRRIEEEIARANREHHRGFMMACGHLKEHSNVHYADAAEMEIAALRTRINELESAAAGKGGAS